MNSIYFGEKDLTSYGVFYDRSKTFKKSQRRHTNIVIPGKNGDLVQSDNTFENVMIQYPCFIRNNFEENYDNLTNYLNSLDNSYRRLETTEDYGVYRKAVFHSAIEPNTGSFNLSGKFMLEFDCKPQRFLRIGDEQITFTESGTLRNPTLFPSQPLIRVYGHGRIVLNDAVISISGDMSMEYIDIDCERMESYSGSTELDSYVVFMTENDYPTLKPGDNDISFTDLSISRVVITPRWWKL